MPALVVALSPLAVACGGDDGEATATEPPIEEATVTFWQDVAPIFFDRCVACHQDGGAGPFALDDYAEAKRWATAASAAVQAKTMPPWLITDDGSCGTFEGSRALAPDEIDTIKAWADAGAPEGEPRTDLKVPEAAVLSDGVTYETPEFLPQPVGGDYATFDEYRCFRVDHGLTADRFLTASSVEPGVPEMVHHLILITVDPEAEGAGGMKNKDIMAALDAESPDRDGWPCLVGAGNGVTPRGAPISWAPGQGIAELPEGIGYRIRKDDWLIMQVHYNLTDEALKGVTDKTAVRVRYADSVEREGHFILPDGFVDTLATDKPGALDPGKESVKFSFELPVGQILPKWGATTGELYGVLPHMHQFGRKQRIELVNGDAAPVCTSDVQRWDFNWQLYYFYQQPFQLGPDSKLQITCDYDTRSVTDPVTPGWGTGNEMCLAGLFIVPET